jgi:hypothetical protein
VGRLAAGRGGTWGGCVFDVETIVRRLAGSDSSGF